MRIAFEEMRIMGIIKTIGYIIAAIILIPLALACVAAFVFGIDEGFENTDAPTKPTMVETPTVIEQTAKTASQILPRCTEIGDGVGWTVNYKINDITGTSEGHYYKDDRTVIINVTISDDKNAAMVLYYDLYKQLGRDEYSPMEYAGRPVGDQSILRIYECPAGYGYNCIESGDGVFITNNIVVTVTVEDYHVTARDVSRYGGQMDI